MITPVTPVKNDLLTNYVTQKGVASTSLKGLKILKVIGRVTAMDIAAHASQQRISVGFLVMDQDLTAAQVDPGVTNNIPKLQWTHLEFWEGLLFTGDTNASNFVSQADRNVRHNPNRVFHDQGDSFQLIYNALFAARVAWDLRILVRAV